MKIELRQFGDMVAHRARNPLRDALTFEGINLGEGVVHRTEDTDYIGGRDVDGLSLRVRRWDGRQVSDRKCSSPGALLEGSLRTLTEAGHRTGRLKE